MRRSKDRSGRDQPLQLQEYLPYRFSRVAEAMSQHLAKRYVGVHGLKRHEWRLLHILSQGGSITTQELIARTSLDRLRVSRAAIRLEDKGFLARVTHPHDQRAHLMQLTPKGRAVYDEIAPVASEFQALLLSTLHPDEVRVMGSVLTKITRMLEEAGDLERSDASDLD